MTDQTNTHTVRIVFANATVAHVAIWGEDDAPLHSCTVHTVGELPRMRGRWIAAGYDEYQVSVVCLMLEAFITSRRLGVAEGTVRIPLPYKGDAPIMPFTTRAANDARHTDIIGE